MTEYVVIRTPRLKRDWVGKTVRLTRGAVTMQVDIPAGTIMTVVRYSAGRKGAHLKGARCQCCGIAPFVHGMKEGFEFLEPLAQKNPGAEP